MCHISFFLTFLSYGVYIFVSPGISVVGNATICPSIELLVIDAVLSFVVMSSIYMFEIHPHYYVCFVLHHTVCATCRFS
jgi:hypothetical protein